MTKKWNEKIKKSVIQSETDSTLTEQILFSIITVCYNSENVIEKTIRSVLHQTYPYIEYLIIDGYSEDSTISIAERYKGLFKKKGYKYSIISEQDKGIYDAMNKGIRFSTGELIGFINAGDWYEKNAVSIVAKEYRRSSFDYFYADIKLIKPNGKIIIKHSKPDCFPSSRHWNHPTSFCRKELYIGLGGFKCRGIHDDFDFFLRVRKSGKKVRILNRVLANFTVGGISNKKNINMCRQRIGDRYKVYKENGYSSLYLLECFGMEIAKYILS